MNPMAELKVFNNEELFGLLHVCAHNLSLAYQETQEKTLFLLSEEAYRACDFLMYQIQRESYHHSIH